MKTILYFLFFGLISQQLIAQIPEKKVTSKIEKVTIFTSGAQVERSAKVQIPKGKTQLIFKGISPRIDKQSIQVKGDERLTILSVTHQMNYLNEQKRRSEITVLEAQKESLSQKKITENSMLEVFKTEHEMLLKNQAIGGENTGIQTSELRQAIDFHRQRLTEIISNKAKIQQAISKLDSAIQNIGYQLSALNNRSNYATSEVLVTVMAKSAISAQFDLSYLVQDAGWFANYDLRVKNISSPLSLALKANVFQSSGEDWKDVKLTISNGNPSENTVAPELEKWTLGFGYNYNKKAGNNSYYRRTYFGNVVNGQVINKEDGTPVIGASILVKGTSIGTITDIDGFYTLNLPANAQALQISFIGTITQTIPISSSIINCELEPDMDLLDEVVVVGYGMSGKYKQPKKKRDKKPKYSEKKSIPFKESYQPTTTSFEIEIPYTILNDGKTYAVDIRTQTIPADYQYFTVPKLDQSAYLTALIKDWQELNLLAGEVNLFFEGAFLGKSILDVDNASDTLNISLGKDKSISVERKNLKDFTSKKFLSSYKSESRAYEIKIRNNRKEPIKILVQDQFPTSSQKTITIENKEAKGAKVEVNSKILSWEYELEAQKEKKHTVKYTVKYPKNEIVELE